MKKILKKISLFSLSFASLPALAANPAFTVTCPAANTVYQAILSSSDGVSAELPLTGDLSGTYWDLHRNTQIPLSQSLKFSHVRANWVNNGAPTLQCLYIFENATDRSNIEVSGQWAITSNFYHNFNSLSVYLDELPVAHNGAFATCKDDIQKCATLIYNV